MQQAKQEKQKTQKMADMNQKLLIQKYPFSPDRLRIILNAIPANVFFKDTEGRYQITSHICERLNAAGSDGIVGKTDLDIQADAALGRKFHGEDMEIIRTGVEMHYMQEMIFDGVPYYYDISKMPVYDGGVIVGIIGIVQDVTEHIQLQRQLREWSEIDALTGVGNRLRYNKLIDGGGSFRYPTSVVMADCNRLKTINDRYGHSGGDLMLVTTVNNIRRILADRGQMLRLGGDEFLIIIPECDEHECRSFIAQFRESESSIQIYGVPLSTSYGYSVMNSSADSLADAVKAADAYMYEEKAKYKQTES